MALQEGSLVRFSEDYKGEYKFLKGQTMTVMQVFPKNRVMVNDRVTLLEITEVHLLHDTDLVEVTDAPSN